MGGRGGGGRYFLLGVFWNVICIFCTVRAEILRRNRKPRPAAVPWLTGLRRSRRRGALSSRAIRTPCVTQVGVRRSGEREVARQGAHGLGMVYLLAAVSKVLRGCIDAYSSSPVLYLRWVGVEGKGDERAVEGIYGAS